MALSVSPASRPSIASYVTVSMLLACLSMAALPAQAGFRYVPPAQQMASPPVYVNNTAPQAAQPTNGFVQGFANQVPLTVALRQVLPRGMAFRIADNIAPTTQVSWRGGQAWQQTLDQMLAGAGLQASYSQNTVLVQRGAMLMGAQPASAQAMAPQPMPQPMPPSFAPVTLTPPVSELSSEAYASEAPAYVAPVMAPAMQQPAMQPLMQPLMQPMAQVAEPAYAPPMIEPAPQPYITTAATGTAVTVADGNATVGAEQRPTHASVSSQANDLPMQAAPGMLPTGTVDELPQQNVPGTEIGGLPPMQSSALNPLNPGPAEAPALQPTAPQAQLWEAHSGQSLHEVIVAWAQRANVELNWVSEYDYPIEASLAYTGSFEDAVRTLLGGFVNAAPQPVGRLHRNDQLGQQALIIETRGNQYDE